MKVLLILALCSHLSLQATEESVDANKLSEAFGHLLVRQLETPGIFFDFECMIQGIRDELAGKPSPLSEEEYQTQISIVQENAFLKMAEQNLGAAEDFLKNNASEQGVISVDSQLQYKVTSDGQGKEVAADSSPLIHYTGKLLDGTTFASSHETQQPIVLPMNQTIAGFSKGLVGMKEGEKRILYIHPELAYGLSGQLPPNSLLIFEVEVVDAGHPDLP